MTLPVKRWSLAPTEGPERARIRMHQEFEPLIVVGKDGLITQIARKGDNMSSKTPQGQRSEAVCGVESFYCLISFILCYRMQLGLLSSYILVRTTSRSLCHRETSFCPLPHPPSYPYFHSNFSLISLSYHNMQSHSPISYFLKHTH